MKGIIMASVLLGFAATSILGLFSKDGSNDPNISEVVVKDINNNDVKLADYKGKVLLIVNVASKCGFTKQYTGLQEI